MSASRMTTSKKSTVQTDVWDYSRSGPVWLDYAVAIMVLAVGVFFLYALTSPRPDIVYPEITVEAR